MEGLFEQRKLFKLVCGAGNEDAQEVCRLVFVYTLAGAKVFDVSANVDVVRSAMKGIEQAYAYSHVLKRKIDIRPFINVSIGMKGDPHVRKASINEQCARCGACLSACPTGAITQDLTVYNVRCIGCGHCFSVCPANAIEFRHPQKDLRSLLKECQEAGTEQMELHAAVTDSETIIDEWKMINAIITENYVSMCLDRLHLGDSHLRRRIQRAKDISGDRFIVQADGVPMSGGKDDYNTTLQAVAIADIVMKSRIDVKVLLSGGTNSLTTRLADQCGVKWHGVAIGTFARNLVKPFVQQPGFFDQDGLIQEAVAVASELITNNIGEPVW
jgi:ferredoxin